MKYLITTLPTGHIGPTTLLLPALTNTACSRRNMPFLGKCCQLLLKRTVNTVCLRLGKQEMYLKNNCNFPKCLTKFLGKNMLEKKLGSENL